MTIDELQAALLEQCNLDVCTKCLDCIFFHPFRTRPCSILRRVRTSEDETCDAQIADSCRRDEIDRQLRRNTPKGAHNGRQHD